LFPGHENAIRIFNVVTEWRAGSKPELAVKPVSGLEVSHRAGFKAQSTTAPSLRLRDEVFQEPGGDTFPQVSFSGPHGFDFAVPGIQFPQSATTNQLAPVPDTPEGDVGFAQFLEIQGVPAFGWRNFGQAPKMLSQQFDNLGTAQVVDFDFH